MKNFIQQTATDILKEHLLGRLVLVHVFQHPKKGWLIYNNKDKTNNDELTYLGASYKAINDVSIEIDSESDEAEIYLGLNVPEGGCVLFKADEPMILRTEYETM
jgi:hypothetical protein